MNARPSNDSARLTRTRDAALREHARRVIPGGCLRSDGRE